MAKPPPFWKTKTLAQMDKAEWESLCDGCGRCCLHKLRHEVGSDPDGGDLSFTNVACRLLDLHSCQCSDYARRQRKVPDCVSLTPEALREIDWLPPSCAYRRLAEGRDLAWWHPLVSGDPETVHSAGVSVRGRAISERRAGRLEHHIVDWPGRAPRTRRPSAAASGRVAAASPPLSAAEGSPQPKAEPAPAGNGPVGTASKDLV
jgi:uncharacterized cysteine cluster protein YcgN (CxxCxxCC family)